MVMQFSTAGSFNHLGHLIALQDAKLEETRIEFFFFLFFMNKFENVASHWRIRCLVNFYGLLGNTRRIILLISTSFH